MSDGDWSWLNGRAGKLEIDSRPKIDTRCAVTILMDLQFQGFSCTYATKENREAFSYIVVFVVVVSLLYEKETFFTVQLLRIFSFFFLKSIEKL